MPVPVGDCTDMSLLDEPLDTVLSDDIWKKFDLDEPLDAQYIYGYQTVGGLTSSIGNGNNNGLTSDKTIMTMMMSGNAINNSLNNDDSLTGQSMNLPDFYDKISCRESREIRHHDCMWAGLCISKEHNRTLPAKKDNLVNSKKVPAGRSLLISSRNTSLNNQQQQQNIHNQQIHHQQQQQTLYNQRQSNDGLESDGDSARPETPQSSESESESEEEDENDEEDEDDDDEDDETDTSISARRRTIQQQPQQQQQQQKIRVKQEIIEDDPLIFKHDQISINEKLSECMSDDMSNERSAPVSEVTGQSIRKYHQYHPPHHNLHHYHHHHHHHHHHHNHKTDVRIKVENEQDDYHHRYRANEQQQQRTVVKNEPDNWNTLNDHCYHQPSSKNLDHLGVQTPSDSEEEIDVVTFEKPCRPAALPTYPSIADQQHFQLTVKSALKEKPVTTPRPRGRPPSNGTPRKRSAPNDTKPSKRPKHRTYQSRVKFTKNGPPTPAPSPSKVSSSSSVTSKQITALTSRSSSSDEEPDTEKRSLHNNMERQRRIELRNAFEDLRLLVPEIEKKEKAPKVAILRQAAIYCDMLTEIGQVTSARVIEMKKRQEKLRARLSQLRRNLAMTR